MSNFQDNFSDLWLMYLLWNCPKMNIIVLQVMAWCRQATSHYLSQCWPSSMSPYGITRPQWVNIFSKKGYNDVFLLVFTEPSSGTKDLRQPLRTSQKVLHLGKPRYLPRPSRPATPLPTKVQLMLEIWRYCKSPQETAQFDLALVHVYQGLTLSIWFTCPSGGHVVLKIYVLYKNFHVPSQYLYKSCKAYAYCWKNKFMPRLKIHLPCRARNHKSSCALGQDVHALGTRARLNVEPCVPGDLICNVTIVSGVLRCQLIDY